MSWPPVLSQLTYPGHDPVPGDGKPDYDDCAVVATIWAAAASSPGLHKPTIPEFRKHAGKPDTAGVDGLGLDDIVQGIRGQWPTLTHTRFVGAWSGFSVSVRNGMPASLAVWSGDLPPEHRYGFNGAHQIGVAYDDRWLVMNPLAKDGTALQPISETALSKAALSRSLQYGGLVRAVLFPIPLPDTSTEDDMEIYATGGRMRSFPKGTPYYDKPNGKRTGAIADASVVYRLDQDRSKEDWKAEPGWWLLDGGGEGVRRWVNSKEVAG